MSLRTLGPRISLGAYWLCALLCAVPSAGFAVEPGANTANIGVPAPFDYLAILLAFALGALLAARWAEKRSVKQKTSSGKRERVAARLDEWIRTVAQSEDLCRALRAEHPIVFGRDLQNDGLKGTTEAAFRDVGLDLDELFLHSEKGRMQLDYVRQLWSANPEGLSAKDYTQQYLLLTDAPLNVSTQDVYHHQRLVDQSRHFERTAGTLLTYLQGDHSALQARAGILERSFGEAPQRFSVLTRALDDVEVLVRQQIDRDRILEFYGDELSALIHKGQELESLVNEDPMSVFDSVQELERCIGELREKVERLAGLLVRSRDAQSRKDVQVSRLAELRRKSKSPLVEPGFEPESFLDRAGQWRVALDATMAKGDLARSEQFVNHLELEVDALTAGLDGVLSWSGEGAKVLEDLEAQIASLESGLKERKSLLAKAKKHHSKEAVQPIVKHVAGIKDALSFAKVCVRDARSGLLDKGGRVLASKELAARAVRAMARIQEVYEQVDGLTKTLENCESEARVLIDQASQESSSIRSFLMADERFASALTVETSVELNKALSVLVQALDEEAPNWLHLRKEGGRVRGSFARLANLANAEKTAFDRFQGLQRDVRTLSDHVRDLIQGAASTEPLVLERFEEGKMLLAQARAELATRARPHWIELVELLERAEEILRDSERCAHQGLNVSQLATRALASAISMRDQGNRERSYGIHADMSGAERRIQDAREALQKGALESCLRHARSAEAAASDQIRKARARQLRAWLAQIDEPQESSEALVKRRDYAGETWIWTAKKGAYWTQGDPSFGSTFSLRPLDPSS